MKRRVEEFTIEEIYKIREQITFPDYQREPNVWTSEDKQLLMDSILQEIDIPKLYFNRISKDGYEVIDGQQRLWAIWEFLDDMYLFKTDSKDEKLKKMEGYKFSDMKDLRDEILSYKLQIVMIANASEAYLRKLFLRLQLGKLLIMGEKLNASVGKMKDFVFNRMVKHSFIQAIKISDRRFAKQTLCAHICINSFTRDNLGEFVRTRYDDLKYFFEIYSHLQGTDLKNFEDKCNKIIAVLDLLGAAFKEKAHELRNRSFILSVYLFVEELLENQKREINKIMPMFVEFSIKMLSRLKEETAAGIDRKNKELYVLESYLSNAPGEKYQIERRHKKLKELFEYYQKTGKIKGDK